MIIFVGGLLKQIPEADYQQYCVTYWMETIAVEAFGFSWLVKGEALFEDNKK